MVFHKAGDPFVNLISSIAASICFLVSPCASEGNLISSFHPLVSSSLELASS